jgi:S1-C subfamily serine protease
MPAGAFAQDSSLFVRTAAADPPAAVSTPDPLHGPDDAHIEAQLKEAQARLEEAARQVAELSTQLSTPLIQKFSKFEGTSGQSIIGVQLDPSGGKEGARVFEVSPGGPAAEAGIRPGDIIVAVNGTPVTGESASRQVIKIIRRVKPDSKVNVRVLRDGKAREFTVTARPSPGWMAFDGAFPPIPPMQPLKPFFPMQGPLANMELATLSPQLGKYFGTDKGVLVVRAPEGGALKLEDGDVILSIDGREPKSGAHATRILSSYQPGEKIGLKIVRQRKTMDLDTTVPDGRDALNVEKTS